MRNQMGFADIVTNEEYGERRNIMPVIFEDPDFNIDSRLVSTVAKSTSVILTLDKENEELKELIEALEETIDLMAGSGFCT